MFMSTPIPARSGPARVESVAPAAGSEFSILPAQNSSGNWVKVVQRIPVRIHVDAKSQIDAAAGRHERHGRDRYRPSPRPFRAALTGGPASR